MEKDMRDEMVYIPVKVHLKYKKGFRKEALDKAKSEISFFCDAIESKTSTYSVICKGKIRERKVK